MLLLVLFIILLDQIIKYFVSTNMFLGQSIPVLPQIFHLTYIQNPGAAFGILENQRYLFILIAAVLIVAVIYFYKKIIQLSKLFQVGIALLFGGAIGNMIDRIFIGRVIDYMDFRIWPVFNLADIAIVSGCAIIAFNLLFKTERSYKA
ncbi:signal peptidase II [Megamonas hypermegale]|uniref:signal peptidase II n=1 Tax=Megamonas hypermegale TaxID=158847 RepID=UPI00388DC719